MSYNSTRDEEQLRILGPSIDDFIDRYNNSDSPAQGPRQTIFFFPGGMASTLKRARKPYLDNAPSGQMFKFDKVWLTIEDFLGGVLDLEVSYQNGEYRDQDDKIIVADGTVEILGWTFYDGFTDWCEDAGLDYFVFGWDWRRRLEHSGEFFITKFLPYFQERVQEGCNNADPLTNFSLVGHSAGGMIVNWVLRESPDYPILHTLQKAITVSTPFYGYASQVHRWFEGDSYFNHDVLVDRDKLIKLICSLPSCYSWLFLEEQTFNSNWNEFAQDTPYPLNAYPSTDKTTGAAADPYHPLLMGNFGRYPTDKGFSMQELANGGDLIAYLSGPLNAALAEKFFNIRGDNGKADTIGSVKWDWVPPTDPTPIQDYTLVAGDDTQPGWSARHLDLLSTGHVITVKDPHVSHMLMMNVPEILEQLGNLIGV